MLNVGGLQRERLLHGTSFLSSRQPISCQPSAIIQKLIADG
jgi:hypothetical protein